MRVDREVESRTRTPPGKRERVNHYRYLQTQNAGNMSYDTVPTCTCTYNRSTHRHTHTHTHTHKCTQTAGTIASYVHVSGTHPFMVEVMHHNKSTLV